MVPRSIHRMRRRGALSFARHSTSDTGLELETGLIGGVEERELVVVPYQSEWAEAFRLHAERISAALGSVALAFEHVGSTSVPSLAAKCDAAWFSCGVRRRSTVRRTRRWEARGFRD